MINGPSSAMASKQHVDIEIGPVVGDDRTTFSASVLFARHYQTSTMPGCRHSSLHGSYACTWQPVAGGCTHSNLLGACPGGERRRSTTLIHPSMFQHKS